MLSCEEALEQMSQALDGPLTGEEQGELEAHLACCPACRADWAALRELHQAMGELEETLQEKQALLQEQESMIAALEQAGSAAQLRSELEDAYQKGVELCG